MSTASVTKESWGALVLGGVATITFGVAVIFWPGLTILTLLYIFSAYALASGLVNIMAGLSLIERTEAWFLPVVLGAFELGVGVYLLRHIAVKFSTFILLIGFVLIVRGIIEAVGSYFNSANASTRSVTLSYLSGLGALVAGIVILFSKQEHGVGFVWILGLYALVIGAIQISELARGNK